MSHCISVANLFFREPQSIKNSSGRDFSKKSFNSLLFAVSVCRAMIKKNYFWKCFSLVLLSLFLNSNTDIFPLQLLTVLWKKASKSFSKKKYTHIKITVRWNWFWWVYILCVHKFLCASRFFSPYVRSCRGT